MEYTKISKKMKSPVDGLELDLLILVPEEAPKGILQIHHGMAEYKERYLPFMKYFADMLRRSMTAVDMEKVYGRKKIWVICMVPVWMR